MNRAILSLLMLAACGETATIGTSSTSAGASASGGSSGGENGSSTTAGVSTSAGSSDTGSSSGGTSAGASTGASSGNIGTSSSGGNSGGTATGTSTGGAVVIQPLGTVTSVTYQPTCDSHLGNPLGMRLPDGGPNPLFRCAIITVSCGNHGDDDDVAEVGLLSPPGPSQGVVVTHTGSGGTSFLSGGVGPALLDAGFSLAQIAWTVSWECPKQDGGLCATDSTSEDIRPGLKDAACRPATAIQWIHDSAQIADGGLFWSDGEPFCGTGGSGGSGAFWFTLLHYGGWRVIDFAMLTASSPFGRVDVGCDPSQAGGTIQPTCNNFASPPAVTVYDDFHPPGSSSLFNTWFSTSSCDSTSSPPTAEDLALWGRNSVVSSGGDFDIPTPVTTWDCIDLPSINVVPGGGTYVFNAVHANDPGFERFTYNCVVTGDGGNGFCSGENVFGDPDAVQIATSEFESRCVVLARDGG